MKIKSKLLIAALALLQGTSWAQGAGGSPAEGGFDPGFQAAIHVGGQAPNKALSERFGLSNTVGLSVYHLSAVGWRWGVHYRFQTGSDVREPGLLVNLRDPSGRIIDNEGRIALVTAQQRGTVFSLSAGRLFPTDFLSSGSGLLLEVLGGYWEHKVHFQNRGNRLTQLDEPHIKGYDRLTGGLMVMPRLGYVHDSSNGLVRFQCGVEAMLGNLQPNRVWNADTMMADEGPRKDGTIGVFAAWILRLKPRSTDVDYYH